METRRVDMKGTGRSIREEKELSYSAHCKEVFTLLVRIDQWDWKEFLEVWRDALQSLMNGIFWVCALVLSPILIPVAAYVRKRRAAKMWDSCEQKKEKVMG